MPKNLVTFLIIVHYTKHSYLVQSCGCSKYTYRPYMEHMKYLVRLPDTTTLRSLALIGTHLSLSYHADNENLRTQELTLKQQLKYGIRVFDISVRVQPDSFQLKMNYVSSPFSFHDLLFMFDEFLDHNPGEFLIVFINQERTAAHNDSENNCAVIDYYMNTNWGGWRLVKDWKLSDPIGMYRNQILLASLDLSFARCTFNINAECDGEIYKKVGSVSYYINIIDMHEYIIQSITKSFVNPLRCYINDISFADHKNSRRTIAKDGGYQFRNICSRPLNDFMVEHFEYSKRALTIVLADYVTQELIDQIYDSNFLNSSWRGR